MELQNLFNENLYAWKDINVESYSNQIKRLVEHFRQESKVLFWGLRIWFTNCFLVICGIS